jgi:hypothetical protein
MGSAILYCYRCNTQLREALFEQGKAYRIDTRVCCSDCAAAAVRELPPDRVKVLLDQLQGNNAAPKPPSVRARPPMRDSRPMAAPMPKQATSALPWVLGGAVVGIAVLAVVIFGSRAPAAPPPAPSAAPVAAQKPKPVGPETPAQAALRKALSFAERNQEDHAGQIREFEGVLLMGDHTPVAEEAKRQLVVARAKQKEAVERGMVALERELEEPLRVQAYGRAMKLLETALTRRADPQWTFAVEKRTRELKASIEAAYGPQREKAVDAKARGAGADVDAVLARVAAWELPSHLEALKRELDSVVTQLTVEDFDAMSRGWKYVGGEEFKGAKGSLTVDTAMKKNGKASFRLNGDFSGGGYYVGVWLDVGERLSGRDVKELRLWVKTSTRPSLGIRLADASGQVHQSHVNLSNGANGEWQELVLRIKDLVGGERWGGANDGKWHGPIRGLGINVGRSVEPDQKDMKPAEIWFDDLVGVLAEAERPR